MRSGLKNRLLAPLVALFLVVPAAWATQGSFRGIVVQVPEGQPSAGYLYLKSTKGGIRKVEIGKAQVVGESSDKNATPEQAKDRLKPGTDVRVTAEQSNDGEWHASRIEIVTNDSNLQSGVSGENGMQPATTEDDDVQYAPDAALGQGSIRRI